MSDLALKALHLTKSFRGRKVADDVSFQVEPAQVVGLLGPNGAGKTTSFYMIVGLIQADSGQVTLQGDNITSFPMFKRAQKGLSYLAQEPSVFRKLTVEENLWVALEAAGLGATEARERFEFLMESFRIAHIRKSFGYSLSGGERRRVEIARCLAGRPLFVLLDEPFAGIDPIAIAEIQDIIRALKDQSIGVLITDHNVRETLGICDFAYILKDGKIQVEGTPSELAENETARQFYLGKNFRL